MAYSRRDRARARRKKTEAYSRSTMRVSRQSFDELRAVRKNEARFQTLRAKRMEADRDHILRLAEQPIKAVAGVSDEVKRKVAKKNRADLLSVTKPLDEKKREQRCKANRPDPKKPSKRGKGNSRAFVPWCQK